MPDMKILVVDDDGGVVSIIISSLKAAGRTFITASDGVEAVEKVMSESPDLILLDVMMPKMNGYQVCRLIKNDRNTWDIPVIMLTAKDRDSDRLYGNTVGADAYIVKPFHPQELRTAVDGLLERHARTSKACPVEPPSRLTESSLLAKVNSLLDRKLQEMTFLQQMTKAMVSTFDEERILELVLEGIRNYLGYEHSVVFMSEEDGRMTERASMGFPVHADRYSFGLDDTGLLHRLIHLREPVVLRGEWDHGRFIGGPEESGGLHALVPIIARDEVAGVILIDRSAGGAPFSPERTDVLNTMAGQLALALDNARLYRRTLVMSITDGLTGLSNARHFYDRLEIEMSRASRYGHPLSLLMLDIDHFKAFNDDFGHLTGDEALKGLAEILRSSIRDADTAARYGGEEFCLILPETDDERAGVLAERIRREVEENSVNAGPRMLPRGITVSIGYASLADGVVTPEDFVRLADKALYKAKRDGRNRACRYDSELI